MAAIKEEKKKADKKVLSGFTVGEQARQPGRCCQGLRLPPTALPKGLEGFRLPQTEFLV